jgi:hypothetical protein
MSMLLILCYYGILVIWTVVSFTTANFKPLTFYVWLRLVLQHEHVHSHYFVWLLLVACTILLYNRIHTESSKLCENLGPVYTLENLKWCRKACFVGAAILRGGCLPLANIHSSSYTSISAYLLTPSQVSSKRILTYERVLCNFYLNFDLFRFRALNLSGFCKVRILSCAF